MPRYEYQCPHCGHRTTAVRSIADRAMGPMCCSSTMEKHIFTPTMCEFPEWDVNYKCVATGQEVTSRSQRKQILDRHGLADAREFGEPDFEQMAEQSRKVKEDAAKPVDIPQDLREAMHKEGMSDLL